MTMQPNDQTTHTARIRHLHVLAYAEGFTLWMYKLSDTFDPSVAESPNFFGAISATMLQEGDMIIATGKLGAKIYVVTNASFTDETVTVAPLV